MVDVRAGVAAPALDHPVDEALEDLALAVAVARPRGLVAHGAVLVAVAPAEQVLEPARRLVERVALEVEPDVAEVGLREEPEAAPLLVGQVVDAVLAGLAEVELELGLVADPLERLRPHAVDLEPGCLPAERGQRRDPVLGEILGLAPAQPGDEDEVVVVSELLLAEVAEVAEPAVVARPRVGLGLGLERAEEPLARAPEVRHVLGGAERLALPAAELDVEVLRQPPLDPPELLGVEAELEHVRAAWPSARASCRRPRTCRPAGARGSPRTRARCRRRGTAGR